MRILYCIPHLYNSGGMERVLTQKVNWLAAHTQHEITILTTEPVPAGTPKCYFPLSEKVQVEELNIDFNADYIALDTRNAGSDAVQTRKRFELLVRKKRGR